MTSRSKGEGGLFKVQYRLQHVMYSSGDKTTVITIAQNGAPLHFLRCTFVQSYSRYCIEDHPASFLSPAPQINHQLQAETWEKSNQTVNSQPRARIEVLGSTTQSFIWCDVVVFEDAKFTVLHAGMRVAHYPERYPSKGT